MIFLFKINHVFWNNKPKVDDYYTFDIDDINFDILNYDISLYFPICDYYLMSDSNEDIYNLRLEHINKNPTRILIEKDTEIYRIIRDFYEKNI